MQNYAETLFIDAVRDLQDEAGTGDTYEKIYPSRTQKSLAAPDIRFISERESFYIASASSTGWPYIQHRGGPKGFLKVLDTDLLGFADYSGNKQFITMGHSTKNDKVALFLMDYENRARLKILGHLSMRHKYDADPSLFTQLETEGQGNIERIATIKVTAIDWNCPKYIPKLINKDKLDDRLLLQIQKLTAENESLKQQLFDLENK